VKIALVQPPRPQAKGVEAEGHWELTRPLSLFYLAASIAHKTDYETIIIDFESKKYAGESLRDVFEVCNADIFAITATTYTRFEAIKIAKIVKSLRPESVVVVGGVHFMYCPEDTLRKVPEIDVVVRGEGEVSLVKLAEAINEGNGLDTIRGISYRRDGKIVHNPEQDTFEDLDSVPVYTNFEGDEYPEYVFVYPERLRAISVMATRGCPNNCIFCSKGGMKYRLRDPLKVVDEIEYWQRRFGIEGINFLDLTFTGNTHHVQSICEELIRRDLDIKWWCESRANIPLELLDIMKRAGCVSLVVGVESGSPKVLSTIKKRISVDQVLSFCRKCDDIGIFVVPYFMFSFPGETERDARETINLIRKLEQIGEFVLECSFQPCMIFPGTQIEQMALKDGILPRDFSWSEPYESEVNVELGQLSNVPLYIDQISPRKLKALKDDMNTSHWARTVKQEETGSLIIKGLKAIREGRGSSFLSTKFISEYLRAKLSG